MLSMKRCPHTGVVNLFDTTDPHFAVGSIAKGHGRSAFHWHCYSGETDRGGLVSDLKAAKHALIACYEVSSGDHQARTYAI